MYTTRPPPPRTRQVAASIPVLVTLCVGRAEAAGEECEAVCGGGDPVGAAHPEVLLRRLAKVAVPDRALRCDRDLLRREGLDRGEQGPRTERGGRLAAGEIVASLLGLAEEPARQLDAQARERESARRAGQRPRSTETPPHAAASARVPTADWACISNTRRRAAGAREQHDKLTGVDAQQLPLVVTEHG